MALRILLCLPYPPDAVSIYCHIRLLMHSSAAHRTSQSSSRTCSMYSKTKLHRSHLKACIGVDFKQEQLNAQPIMCQKSSARDHRLWSLKNDVSILSRAPGLTGSPPSPSLRCPPSRLLLISNLLNANAVFMSDPTGPMISLVSRRSLNAALACSCFSRDVVRVVSAGWTARVTARDRCCGEGTKAGTPGSRDAEDEDRSET